MASVRTLGLLLAQSCLLLEIAGCNQAASNIDPIPNQGGNQGGNQGSTGNSSSAGGASSSRSSAGGNSNTNGTSKGQGGTTNTDGNSSSGGNTNSKSSAGGDTSTNNSSAGGSSSTSNSSAGGTSSSSGKKTGGTSSTGGSTASSNTKNQGGTSAGGSSSGSAKPLGGTSGGGKANVGGASAGGKAVGGNTTSSSVSTGTGDCTFTVTPSTSNKMGTVGIVEWSTTLADLSSAKIVYTLDSAGSSILNKGGTAPADVTQSKLRTLLLGLKPSSSYTFHIEATSSSGATCSSSDYNVKTTTLSGAPSITRTATKASAQAGGFVLTTTGGSLANGPAIIIDADGTVVWSASAPNNCSRVHMDYEGANMWMMALNVMNSSGEMRYVSMDGQTSQNNVSGLSKAHHDFTVLKGGIVATMSWSSSGTDPESDLIERSPDGKTKTAFHIGKNLYAGGTSAMGGGSNTYHCNSVIYYPKDDSYVIGDRNPNLYVKVSRAGTVEWQFGGNCSGAPAPKCASVSWNTNHGHHLADNGNFLFFNNGAFGSSSSPSIAYEYKLSTTGTMSATKVKDYTSSSKNHSDSLGDVQRLPNGNTLVTYSNNGLIEELDSSWTVVQTLKASGFGYAEWRETLYGPPTLNP